MPCSRNNRQVSSRMPERNDDCPWSASRIQVVNSNSIPFSARLLIHTEGSGSANTRVCDLPADKNSAIQLLRLVAPGDVAALTEEKLRAGGFGYGDLKKVLFEHYWNYFAPFRARRAELAMNLDYVHTVLRAGAERARAVASKTLLRAKDAAGL